MNSWHSSECKVIEWTRVLWAGSMWRKWTNTTVRRVSDHLSSKLFPVYNVHHVLVPSLQIIKMALAVPLEFRKTEWINLPLAGSIMRRLINMNHRQVGRATKPA